MAPTRASQAARIVLLAVALAAGTAAAYAHQSEARFGVAAPHAGDRWAYNVTSLDGEAVGLPGRGEWTAVSFERSAPHATADAAGTWQVAATLTERRASPGWTDLVVRREVAGGRTLSTTSEQAGGGSSTTDVTLPNNLTASDRERETQMTWWTAYGGEAPCGHASSLQGANIDPVDGVEVAGDCGGSSFRSLGTTGDGLLVLTNGPATLWMAPNCPVPVRVELPLNATRTLVWTLSGFTPGGDDAPATALPVALPPLAVQPGDRPRDGLASAFPLEDALKLARASGPLADFERGHPGAYLRRALMDERVDDAAPGRTRSLRWDLESTDGHDAVRVRVARTWTSPLADARVEQLFRSAPPQDEAPVALKASPGPYPPRAPEAWPTVASALARWRALGGSNENTWGFEAVCVDAACSATEARTIVGHDDRWRPEETVCVSCVVIDRRTADLAAFATQGTAWHETARVDTLRATTLGPLAVGDAPTGRTLPASSAATPLVPLGLAATAGLFLLLALLPAKALVALWHRAPQDHPLRTQLVQLLEAEPGLHHKELQRRLGRGNAVVSHHLRTLEREGRVVARQGPRYKVYFLATQPAPAHAALAKSPLAARILEELGEPATGKQLADRLGVAPSSIAFHVRRFQDAGLVVAHRVGREVVLRRTPA